MNKQFVANIAPEKQDAALEKMIEIIVRELKPAIGAMVDEKLKEAGVGGAGGDMAANLSQYMPPPADDERWNTLPDGDAPARASNGRKMPDQWSNYNLNQYHPPDAAGDDPCDTLPS